MSTHDTVHLTKKIEAYYRGERISNAALFCIGGAAITWTLLLFLWRQGHLSSGFFFATLPLGSFMVFSGGYRFLRSFKKFKYAVSSVGQATFYKEEVDRLESRLGRFKRKRNVNMITLIIGLVSCVVSVLSYMNHILIGTCVSVTFFSALLLVFDLFGQFRVEEYLHFLKKVI